MSTHSIDDLLPHAPLHYAATGEMVKGSLYLAYSLLLCIGLTLHIRQQNFKVLFFNVKLSMPIITPRAHAQQGVK